MINSAGTTTISWYEPLSGSARQALKMRYWRFAQSLLRPLATLVLVELLLIAPAIFILLLNQPASKVLKITAVLVIVAQLIVAFAAHVQYAQRQMRIRREVTVSDRQITVTLGLSSSHYPLEVLKDIIVSKSGEDVELAFRAHRVQVRITIPASVDLDELARCLQAHRIGA